MPMAGSAIFSGWLSGFALDLRGEAWRPHGKYICDYVSTDLNDPWISACSPDLATALIKCARANSEVCKNQLLGSEGRQLLQDNLGCELFTIYNPSGVRATWDNHDAWIKVKHNNKEPAESLANRIVESAELFATGSGALFPLMISPTSFNWPSVSALGPITRLSNLFLKISP